MGMSEEDSSKKIARRQFLKASGAVVGDVFLPKSVSADQPLPIEMVTQLETNEDIAEKIKTLKKNLVNLNTQLLDLSSQPNYQESPEIGKLAKQREESILDLVKISSKEAKEFVISEESKQIRGRLPEFPNIETEEYLEGEHFEISRHGGKSKPDYQFVDTQGRIYALLSQYEFPESIQYKNPQEKPSYYATGFKIGPVALLLTQPLSTHTVFPSGAPTPTPTTETS